MVIVHKAQGFGSDVPALHVIAEDPVPDCDPTELFREDARSLADALGASLPGGTLDALLRELLLRRASELLAPAVRPAAAPQPGAVCTAEELRLILDLHMCADPTPLDAEADSALKFALDRHSRAHGYEDWVDAYHHLLIEGGEAGTGAA